MTGPEFKRMITSSLYLFRFDVPQLNWYFSITAGDGIPRMVLFSKKNTVPAVFEIIVASCEMFGPVLMTEIDGIL